MASVRNVVNDALHEALGFADNAVVDYVVALAGRARDAGALAQQLEAQGLPAAASRSLAERLVKRPAAVAAAPPAPVAAAPARYALLEPVAGQEEGEEEERSKKRLRKKDKGEALRERETEQERDRRERDEFADRMAAKKEAEKRGTAAGAALPRAAREAMEEAARRRQLSGKDEARIQEAKIRARWKYLEKREREQLQALREQLRDEALFEGEQLTEAERRIFEMNEKILALAEQRVNRKVEDGGYQMPDAYEDEQGRRDKKKAENVLLKRYVEEDAGEGKEKDVFRREQEEWEETLISAAIKQPQEQAAAGQKKDEYEMLFEENIEFVAAALLQGDLKKEDKLPALSKAATMQEVRASLPIFPYRESLLQAVRDYQVLIIVGETGSGKTTQVTQYLHEAGYTKRGCVGCTQPRRVAAMSVAARVADEMGVKLGAEVGYTIRFEDCSSERTVIKYLTDGMLLRHFLGEPDLASYSVLMIDEAHERTLHTDLLFGLVKDVARFRPDLKLLISSATLEAEKMSDYFDGAPVFVIPGRRYPVEVMYTKAPEADYVDACIVTVLQTHLTQGPGDILVFLTGQDEVETAAEELSRRTRAMGSKIKASSRSCPHCLSHASPLAQELIVAKIYSTLPSDQQAKIFEATPPGARKVVLATNIAETSLTIPGIVYVVDAGFVKMTSYNPRTGMESLVITPISKAMAQQRAGRAGRVAPGVCFRMYTNWAFDNELEEATVPEIQRTNLASVVLLLKSLGVDDLIHFDFMDPPPAETMIRALEQLYALGALNDKGELTKLGRRMAEIPAEPPLAKMLLASEKYRCSSEVLTITAMLSVDANLFYRPRDKLVHADNAHKAFHLPGGDHLTLLNVYNQWRATDFSIQWTFENFLQFRSLKRARDVRDQLKALCERVEIPIDEEEEEADAAAALAPEKVEAVLKSVTAGFFFHTAKLQRNGSYKTVKNAQSVRIHPSSSLFQSMPRWVVYNELVATSADFMRSVVEIKPEWLSEIAPHFYSVSEVTADESKKLPKQGMGRASARALPDE